MNNSLAYAYYDEPTQSSGLEIISEKVRVPKVTVAGNDEPIDVCNNPYPVFAININGEMKLLKKIIQLRIRYEDGYYFSENEMYHISGYGDSAREALKNAVYDISYFYNYYLSLNENELIGNGLELKRIYSQIL